jgi:hypothetical protein
VCTSSRGASPGALARVPSEALEVGASSRIEPDPFPFEYEALRDAAGARTPETDFAGRVDDAMPWQRAPFRERAQCITDLPGLPRQAGHRRDLTIGRDSALRNPVHDGINARIVVHTSRGGGRRQLE